MTIPTLNDSISNDYSNDHIHYFITHIKRARSNFYRKRYEEFILPNTLTNHQKHIFTRRETMRILIIKLGALGDVLRTTFIAKGLKEKHQDCHITWLTKENAASMLHNNQHIDRLITWNNHEPLANEVFDWIIQLDDEDEVCTFATLLEAKRFQGAYMDDHGKRKYTDDIAPWFGMGLLRPESQGGKEEADRLKVANRSTFQQIYATMFDIEDCSNKQPILTLSEEEKNKTATFKQQHNIEENNTIIGINTGAGARWPLKMIDENKTAIIANTLAEIPDTTILILGGSDEAERNERIKQQCQKDNIIHVEAVPSIREFATIINATDMMICADTLALHLALALSKKTISFFGPTSPWEIDMFNLGPRVFKETACLCCYKKTMFHPNCIDPINVEDILTPAKKIIQEIQNNKKPNQNAESLLNEASK
jgi:heptosyltransferase II